VRPLWGVCVPDKHSRGAADGNPSIPNPPPRKACAGRENKKQSQRGIRATAATANVRLQNEAAALNGPEVELSLQEGAGSHSAAAAGDGGGLCIFTFATSS